MEENEKEITLADITHPIILRFVHVCVTIFKGLLIALLLQYVYIASIHVFHIYFYTQSKQWSVLQANDAVYCCSD